MYDAEDILKDLWKEFSTSTENEHNWQYRAKLIEKLDGDLEKERGKPGVRVPQEFLDLFKHVVTPIVATAITERTQLSGKACHLIGTLAKYLRTQIHPYLDAILPTIIQLCASAKKLNHTNGNQTMATIIQYAGYSPRLLYHVCAAFHEKRMEARKFATTWLTQLLQIYGSNLDPVKDFPTIDRSITAALTDGHISVREAARVTYWQYAKLSHNTANKIMDDLDQTSQHAATALRADSHNPSKSIQAQAVDGPRPKSALSQIRAAKSKQAQQTAKRNITPSSVYSVQSADPLEPTFGSIDRLDGPNQPADARPHAPQSRQPEAEQSANIRHLMSAPRRPRVVATPIQPYQPQVASRPSSKGEATKKSSESKERPTHEKRGGRQTPVIAEDNEHQTVSHHVKKSSVQRHKPDTSVSWATRSISTISSSSEPAAIKSPRRMTEPRKPAQAVPPKHQKSLSTSEAKGNSRHEPAQVKPISDQHLSEDKENASRQVSSWESVRCPSPSQYPTHTRSLTGIVDAINSDQLDALGYRKLQKLVENNPHELILDQEQYTELYMALLEALYSEEVVQHPREARFSRTTKHPAYYSFSILHTVLALFNQYPEFKEPLPGYTVVALVKARKVMGDDYPRVVEALTKSAEAICLSSRITSDPFQSVLALGSHLTSITQEALTPASTETVSVNTVGFGLNLLTTLLKTYSKSGNILYPLHEQQLAALTKSILATYRTVVRREAIQFCCVLHTLIEPEDRFYDMFEEESDRNLIYYCIQSQAVGSSYTIRVGNWEFSRA